ncbi:PAS domain S-box protein [Motiliproteus sp.]|uniref:PAS domain S-box protein n=1 Tax=Motiliproteus sp. TaxID=1898955 RepID=UPI003BABD248
MALSFRERFALFVALIALIALAAMAISTFERRYSSMVENTLSTLLQSSAEALDIWVEGEKQVAVNLAGHPDLVDYVQALLQRPVQASILKSAPELLALRALIAEQLPDQKYRGFFVIDPSNSNIASSRNTNLAVRNLLTEQPRLLGTLWAGKSSVSHVQFSDVPLSTGNETDSPIKDLSLFSGAPIRNAEGRIIALLTLRIDPKETLFSLLDRRRLGKTGETYIFDRQGLMLNESRFDEQLRAVGLLAPNESSAHRVILKDPEVDLTQPDAVLPASTDRPLIFTARNAITGNAGSNLEGYPDYRGVPVVAAWTWNHQLDIGMISQQNLAEAFELRRLSRILVLVAAGVASLGLLILVYIFSSGRRDLQAAEQRLEAIFESTVDGIVVIDEDGIIERVNSAVESTFGYLRSELIGKNVNVLMPEPYHREHDQYLRNYKQTGDAKILGIGREVEGRRADGSCFPLELSVANLRLDHGAYYTGVIRDITERKETQSQLQRERNFNRNVLDSLADQITVLDYTGNIIFSNRAWRESSLGIELGGEGEYLGKNYIDYLQRRGIGKAIPDQSACEQLVKLVQGELDHFEIEYRYHSQDASRWLRMCCTSITNLNRRLVLITYTDITDRVNSELQAVSKKEAVEAVNQVLKLTNRALEQTGFAQYWIDAQSARLLRVSDEACRFLGYSREDLLTMSVMDIDPNYDKARFLQRSEQIRERGWARFETTLRTQDGRDLDVEITIMYHAQKGNGVKQPNMLVAFGQDITQRKSEQVELIYAREQAEQANRAKSAFLATMSHEIRTPLNGVVGMIDVLANTSINDNQREMIRSIQESSFILTHVIDDILDFSKIEAGGLQLESAPIYLDEVVDSVGESLRSLATSNEVDLLIFCDRQIPKLLGDAVRLQQLLYNFVGNAIKFTREVQERLRQVEILAQMESYDPDHVNIRLCVHDNGVGMTPEVKSRLFQAFSQGEDSTTRRFGGTGLGLVICQRLVELMDGVIELQSSPDQGSQFIIHLTLERDKDHPDPPEPSELAGVRALLVTDQERAGWLLSECLRQAGADVETAASAKALEQARNWFTDSSQQVVLIDSRSDPNAAKGLRDQLRQAGDIGPLRFVMLQRGNRRHPRSDGDDGTTLDLNMARRSQLLNAVAASLGWESTKPVDSLITADTALTLMSVDEAQQAGQLILVAEDHSINQKVIYQQLGMLGYVADFADDGVEALRMWRSGKYALVLTDCHMPNMDGYTLAQTIREQESDGQRIPIIAITADALKGVDTSCLEAGMDDYLTKPMKLSSLQSTLAKWMPSPLLKQSLDAQEQSTNSDQCPVEPSQLVEVLGSDEPELLLEFYEDFLKSGGALVEIISVAQARSDLEEVAAQAHKLKSSARMVGANGLADISFTLEQAGKQGLELPAQDIERLQQQFERVSDWIDTYRQEI